MPERVASGTPASPGVSCGAAWRPGDVVGPDGQVPSEGRERERGKALTALAEAAKALGSVANALGGDEAAIVEAAALMAEDPALMRSVEEAIISDGLPAVGAITRATDAYADAIAAIGDEHLAARADDVRSLGRRAARLAAGSEMSPPRSAKAILIARELGPGDVAELAPRLAGVALAAGGATAHAAIVARSLGIPMVTGLGDGVLEIAEGTKLVLDGSRGTLIVDPTAERAAHAAAAMGARVLAAGRAHALRGEPAVTTDGVRIQVLANVATPEELEVALRAGAEGIGLLRTELAFLDARAWPSEAEHAKALTPILAGLGELPAAVRVLDFGADKSPPFLGAVKERGLELLLAHPEAFLEQLRAILLAAQARDIRILLPMVHASEQVVRTRELLARAASELRVDRVPPLGSMIETPGAAEHAVLIAEACEFLSIGTNDLTAATLGADRFAANVACAHDPRVLRSIAGSVTAARQAGIPIEVCGEAASDPTTLPLLVGLGVDELSVGAAIVGVVRDHIRRIDAAQARAVARRALTMDTAEQVQRAVRRLSAARGRQAIPAGR